MKRWQADVAHLMTWALLVLPLALGWYIAAEQSHEHERQLDLYQQWREAIQTDAERKSR